MKSAILELLDQSIIDIERLFRVIVEGIDSTLKICRGLGIGRSHRICATDN